MPFEVVEIQPTPNPDALKFVLDREIASQPTSFFSADAAKEHPVASQLFAIPGVRCLLLLGDFVTVNKQPAERWDGIKRRVREILKKA
jgi:hypothetical protein